MEAKPWPEDLQQSVVRTAVANMDNGSSNNLLLVDGSSSNGDSCSQDNANNNEDKCNRNLRLQQDVQAVISEKGREKIQSILDQVHTLVPMEKLLLYLKLPTENSNTVDPLRQSLNPLGSRSEINQTIIWIQTHLEEDKELSLQKKGVYDDYVRFCEKNSIKPLSTADFGKVMKQVYPNVRPRRLGTRGQSKYCYSGLRNRIKLSAPLLPDLDEKPRSSEPCCTQSELITAAWIIIKEWSESKLSVQFDSLLTLASYLTKEFSVGVGSEAANLVSNAGNAKIKDDTNGSFGYLNRHRETTLQLQRKLQQKEISKETKRKQLQSPRMEQKGRGGKKSKISTPVSLSRNTSPVPTGSCDNSKGSPQSQEHSPVCDSTNLQTLPDFNRFQRPINAATAVADTPLKDNVVSQQIIVGDYTLGKVAIPRITNPKQSPALSSPKRAKNNKYKAIQPKPELCDRAPYNPSKHVYNTAARDLRSQQEASKRQQVSRKKDSPPLITPEESKTLFSRERLISIGQVSKNALDEYLGTSNSQEPEEELIKYFGNNNEDQDTTKKISQLRLLLEKQIPQNQSVEMPVIEASPVIRTNLKAAHKSIIPPNLQNLNAKRRVSFDTLVHEEPVPASPNTRRANINFIPISPMSPNGRQSKCSSTNASPFVSPRITPIPRSRGNSHPYVNSSRKFKFEKSKKVDLEITIPENDEKDYFKGQLTNLPMSAPPSPKTNYIYSKNFPSFQLSQQNMSGLSDILSPEVGQLFTSATNMHPSTMESAFRSQSVPANIANQFFGSQYPLPNEQNSIASGEFNDIDFTNENINVNKIIDDIGESNLDISLTLPTIGQGDFESNSSMVLDENLTLNESLTLPPMDICTQDSVQNIKRSLRMDIDTTLGGLKLPSKSVPSTPIPYNPNLDIDLFNRNISVAPNSKSYPSTPLASETFTYNMGQDYLLNGQPIKDKIVPDMDFIAGNGADKADLFEVYDSGDSSIDNKNGFNFDTPPLAVETGFGNKQGVNESVDDYFIKGVTE